MTEKTTRLSNFWARTITGLSMVFILLAALYLSGWVFASLFLLIALLGLWEFYNLVSGENQHPQKIYGTAAGAMVYIFITLYFFTVPESSGGSIWSNAPLIAVSVSIFLTFIIEIFRNRPAPLNNIAITILGIVYIAIPLALLNAFSCPGQVKIYGFPEFLTGYFLLTWLYDTAAYLYGKQFGKNKFFERISPKKTWEGTLAGVLVAFLTTAALSWLFTDISYLNWLILTFIVIIFGTLGDLVESLIKRGLHVKDSGSILPGHGGILDRFDTMLISAPFVFICFYFINAI